MAKQKFTDEELLNILRIYVHKVNRIPKQCEFKKSNGLPSFSVYYNRFGSLQNTILLSGFEIEEDSKSRFNNKNYSNDELLNILKTKTKEHLKNNKYLLKQDEFDYRDDLPHSSLYQRRFGGIIKAYELIGYNVSEFNKTALENDLITKLKELSNILKRTPNSRDIDRYSKEKDDFYASKTYVSHFGSIYNAQSKAELSPTKIGMNKTIEDMLNDLIKLKNEIGRVPTLNEIDKCEYTCSDDYYLMKFNSYYEALKLAGIPEEEFNKNNIYYTSNGTKCLSMYELSITQWLEDSDIGFDKEVFYRDVIEFDNTLRRFDWVVPVGNKIYYVEMFGIENKEAYDLKTKQKIEDCKIAGINLISIYPSDMQTKSLDEIFSFLFEESQQILTCNAQTC